MAPSVGGPRGPQNGAHQSGRDRLRRSPAFRRHLRPLAGSVRLTAAAGLRARPVRCRAEWLARQSDRRDCRERHRPAVQWSATSDRRSVQSSPAVRHPRHQGPASAASTPALRGPAPALHWSRSCAPVRRRKSPPGDGVRGTALRSNPSARPSCKAVPNGGGQLPRRRRLAGSAGQTRARRSG